MGGLGHDFKAGVNWIHEPTLFATFNGGAAPQLTLNSDSLTSTVRNVTFNGGAADINIPLDLYAVYLQDDWRLNDRMTFNLGLRYDYVDGMPTRPVRQPELPGVSGSWHRRSLRQLPAARGLRPEHAERRGQHPAARRPRLGPHRKRPQRHPRRLGPLHRLRVYELQRPVPGHRRRGRTRAGVLREQHHRHPQAGWLVLYCC